MQNTSLRTMKGAVKTVIAQTGSAFQTVTILFHTFTTFIFSTKLCLNLYETHILEGLITRNEMLK